MKEIWKDIKGYEGLYQVSNFGNIKNKTTNILLKPINHHNYFYVHLCDKNHKRKNKSIHRLVAEMFLDKQNFNEVNHKNGNKYDNHVDNLEWCSHNDNIKHRDNILCKNHKKKIRCIETGRAFNSIRECATYYHKTPSALIGCLRGYKYNKTFAGLHWKYD